MTANLPDVNHVSRYLAHSGNLQVRYGGGQFIDGVGDWQAGRQMHDPAGFLGGGQCQGEWPSGHPARAPAKAVSDRAADGPSTIEK